MTEAERSRPAAPVTGAAGMLRVPPEVTTVNRAFWTGGAEGELRIMRCDDCATWVHPPRERCRTCGGGTHPSAVSGSGTIVTFTVNHQQWNPAGTVSPYVVALVELDEQPGLRLLTNIVGSGPSEVSIGARVAVEFEALSDVWLPLFRLVNPSTHTP